MKESSDRCLCLFLHLGKCPYCPQDLQCVFLIKNTDSGRTLENFSSLIPQVHVYDLQAVKRLPSSLEASGGSLTGEPRPQSGSRLRICRRLGGALRRLWKRLGPNWPGRSARKAGVLPEEKTHFEAAGRAGGRLGGRALRSGLAVGAPVLGAKLASPRLTLQTWQAHDYLTPGRVPAHSRFRSEPSACRQVGLRTAFLLCTTRL